jgi:hypothetical protein
VVALESGPRTDGMLRKAQFAAPQDHLVSHCLFDNTGRVVRVGHSMPWSAMVCHAFSEGHRAMSRLDLYLVMLGSVLLFFWLLSLLLG